MDASTVLVNKQFNSPIMLYSPENVTDVLNKQSQILANGTVGIDFHKMSAPGNLKNSAVLRMLEEAEKGEKENIFLEKSKPRRRIQQFEWPPRGPDNNNDPNCDDGDYNNNNTHPSSKVTRVSRPRPRFTTAIPIVTSAGLKRVAWPPPPPDNELNGVQESVYPKEPVFYQPFTTPSDPSQALRSPPTQQPTAAEPVFQRTVQTAAPVLEPPPTVVTLRQSAPFYQSPPPIFESQPAAKRVRNPRMRGDEKWPPAEAKAQAVAENEARKALAKGPAFRPRKPKKDYTKFFEQNALASNYPGYRAPPGTQHYIEEGTSNF